MDEVLRGNPREFQEISGRVIYAVNPYKEKIPDTRDLTKRIQEYASKDKRSRKILNFLKGGPRLVFEAANKGEVWAQRLLGWIKPWQKPTVTVRPAVKDWLITGYKNLISELEMDIIISRHELRKLGYPLKPYTGRRLRIAEKAYLRSLGWREPYD